MKKKKEREINETILAYIIKYYIEIRFSNFDLVVPIENIPKQAKVFVSSRRVILEHIKKLLFGTQHSRVKHPI